MSHDIIDVTDQNFDAVVLGSPTPVIVEFYAHWCGPSQQMQAETVRSVTNIPGCRVGRLNTDANRHTPVRFGVYAIPATRLFNGTETAAALAAS